MMFKRWIAFFAAFAVIGTVCLFLTRQRCETSVMAQAVPFTVVLDAGHGGEDGGAVAFDGTNEKDINLKISEAAEQYFDWFGIPYVAVRENDCLIGDNTLPTVRERKVSDIRTRMSVVNDTLNAVLLSIHQNFFTSEKYWGAQVFYAKNVPSSAVLAERIQRKISSCLQPDNTRKIKPTEGTVYLLDKAEKPSVMVECGFLSNPQELDRLKDQIYQSQIAYLIVSSVCEYFNESIDAIIHGTVKMNR